MDHHERERERGRTSRASSTSSLGREVRCACQFFQSDSLLPERFAIMNATRPSSRNAARPAITRTKSDDDETSPTHVEHEYEPIGTPLINVRTMTPVSAAPVVRIIDTDVVPVADSDESIDLRGRFTPGPVLEGNELILPLDGQIEDSAMETRELAGGGDTSEELESPQQLQDRLEERFLNAATPCTESRTDGEVNTSQVDSVAMEELPLRRGARGLPQRLRSQAGKLRTRIKSIQRPNFSLPIDRLRGEKTKKSTEKLRGVSEKSRSTGSEKRSTGSDRSRGSTLEKKVPRSKTEKRGRMERIRSSLPDRPRISLPDRPKFNFPDRSKFHLPERPKFNIKKPNIRFPKLGKARRSPSLDDLERQGRSTGSSGSSKRNIFDFSTYPRLFDRKAKNEDQSREYATSSPKESRSDSMESSTLPRTAKKSADLGQRWSMKFTDIKFADDDDGGDETEEKTLAERSRPWRRPSLEAPRLSLKPQDSMEETLPWEDDDKLNRRMIIPYEDEENDDEPESPIRRPGGLKMLQGHPSDESYEVEEDDDEPPRIDPRLYGDQNIRRSDIEIEEQELDENEYAMKEAETYRKTFMPVDPRHPEDRRVDEPEELEDEEPVSSGMDEDISARSDREHQQSSGSSCDRRRRGVIEEIDSDEFFLREKGISQDDMNVGRYLTSEIRDALRETDNALAHEIILVTGKTPPQRPARTRSMRKRKETSIESYEMVAPTRPKRDSQRRSMEDYDYPDEDERIFADNDDSISGSRHRVVYHAESAPLDLGRIEPLDDIVVVKPTRRRSKSSLRSASLRRSESLQPQPEEPIEMAPPSVPPRRRKRPRNEDAGTAVEAPRLNGPDACNGHGPVAMLSENMEIVKTPIPKKPQRAPSRETLRNQKNDDYREIVAPPVPPKRSSRSRGASLAPDDDRTSRGAESIPETDYNDEDVPPDDLADDDSRLDYPGYAIIDKREKPPRPPPPRKRRDDKFATTPRLGKDPPKRPQRAYSTLRPARSRTPSDTIIPTSAIRRDSKDAYEELGSADEEDRDLRSGEVVSKIQGRPLPAPPRPPRSRRDRTEDSEDLPEVGETVGLSTSEAFASTQTDPLPDDMVIEEEITQAKLIVSPSRSGSQILVSTERIPSPIGHFIIDPGRSISPIQRIPDEDDEARYGIPSDFTSEPPERTVSQIFDHHRRTPSPVRRSTVPSVPPLPMQKYRDELEDDSSSRRRDKSPPLSRQVVRDNREIIEAEARLQASLVERLRLEEELEKARNLRSALMSSEPLKISSLEVGDLRVDRLNVTNLEAQKITASEIDALVVTATELSNSVEAHAEHNVDLHPELLRELVAIRSQLELVNSSQEALREMTVARPPRRRDEVGPREITTTTTTSQPSHLQLDQVSRSMETRAIYSSTGSSRESSPQPTLTSVPAITLDETTTKLDATKEEIKTERRSTSRSRSSSPGRTGSPTCLRQIASPVKSLPPVISVTPDTPDTLETRVESSVATTPLRATISYTREDDFSPESLRELAQSSQRPVSPPSPPTIVDTRFIAFPTSQIPPEFFNLSSPTTRTTVTTTPTRLPPDEPAIADLGRQLFRALRLASKRAVRHFVGYIVDRIGHEDTDTKIREVEIALCALLLIIAGLLIVCFGGPRTITHHHHWDYFNPPRL